MAVSSGPASALGGASGVAMGYHLAFVTGGLGSSVPRPPVHRLAPARLPRPAPPSVHRQPSSRPRRGPPPLLPPPQSLRRGPQSLPPARRRRAPRPPQHVAPQAGAAGISSGPARPRWAPAP